MKRTLLLSIAALALSAGAAFAHCGSCPGDKKVPSKAEAAPAKKNCGGCPGHKKAEEAKSPGKKCGDCPGHKTGEGDKAAGKKCGNCPSHKEGGEAKAAGKKCGGCPASAEQGGGTGGAGQTKGPAKARAAQQAKKEAMMQKKYSCAMNCMLSDKPGKCPKCGMPMEEKK